MTASKTQFNEYLAQAVQKVKGVYFPVKTSLPVRLLVRKAACESLYPNPEDEFCVPEISPNYGIISSYQLDAQDDDWGEKIIQRAREIKEREERAAETRK